MKVKVILSAHRKSTFVSCSVLDKGGEPKVLEDMLDFKFRNIG